MSTMQQNSVLITYIKQIASYAHHSHTNKCISALRRLMSNSVLLHGSHEKTTDDQSKKHGLVERWISNGIRRKDDVFESFRLKNERFFDTSVLIRWMDPSKFLLIPVAYFVIDYIFRQLFSIQILASLWDEAAILVGFCLIMFRSVFQSKNAFSKVSPMGIPIVSFMLLFLAIMLVNAEYRAVGIEGVRAVTQHMIWYFIAIGLLNSRRAVDRTYHGFLWMGGLFALHGIYQFLMNVPMPAHWMDMAERGVRTRAFSIIGSPNILGAVMILVIPMALALFLHRMSLWNKALYFGLVAVGCLCLLFTQSRGAWIGFIAAMLLFFWMYDKRFLLPVLLFAVLAVFAIPPLYDRISYMLSAEYIASSMRGGRLIRWERGLAMWMDHLWLGQGVGHFGGAVAMNNRQLFPHTFYMDNYYLKVAVEAGVFALFAIVALMATVFSRCTEAYRKCTKQKDRLMVMGMKSALFGLMVHNLVENVFEVPAMVTWFWIITAMTMWLGFSSSNDRTSLST